MMPALELLKQGILQECESDHVGLWSIVRDVENSFPKKTEAAIRKHTLHILRELLLAREIRAGFPTQHGKFRSLRIAPEKVIERIEANWPNNCRPTIGEGLWFTKAKKTDKSLKKYMEKYGRAKGQELFERLQEQTALAPAHRRDKKHLRK